MMNVVSLILAGGQGTRLGVITNEIAKPAVPFAGKYRMIDFTVSNCVNSGITKVGVVTQYMPHELMEHLGIGKPWDLDIKGGGLYILSPYLSRLTSSWYKGTADAVYQNMDFIRKYNPDFVLVLSGDHIYKMDYNELIDYHIEKGADCTIACMEVPYSEASRFGIMVTDPFEQIIEFQEKPAQPKGTLASLGIYVFSWEYLKRVLTEDAMDHESENDFGKNIIPRAVSRHERLFAYNFEGYWRDVGTLTSYLDTNLEILGPLPPLDLHDKSWKIYTQSAELPPAYISENAKVIKSFISEGAEVYGEVENTVVFQGVIIEEGSTVKNSVLMDGCVIGKNTILQDVIVCEKVRIGSESRIGVGEFKESLIDKKVYNSNITVIGYNSVIPQGIIIGKNCVIDNYVTENDFSVKEVQSGEGIIKQI